MDLDKQKEQATEMCTVMQKTGESLKGGPFVRLIRWTGKAVGLTTKISAQALERITPLPAKLVSLSSQQLKKNIQQIQTGVRDVYIYIGKEVNLPDPPPMPDRAKYVRVSQQEAIAVIKGAEEKEGEIAPEEDVVCAEQFEETEPPAEMLSDTSEPPQQTEDQQAEDPPTENQQTADNVEADLSPIEEESEELPVEEAQENVRKDVLKEAPDELEDESEELPTVAEEEEELEKAEPPLQAQVTEEVLEEESSKLEQHYPALPMPAQAELATAKFKGFTEKVKLTKALRELADQEQRVRERAAQALGTIDHYLSVSALAAQLAAEPSFEVRKACIASLTTLKKKTGLPTIEQALSDSAAVVRLAAIQGIYSIAGADGTTKLRAMFNDSSEDVRHRAALCLKMLRLRGVVK
ncbi:HEAT repeat domain-containing protein [Oligoflexia bacterium]|nr:HEAT repeat domain-containing protein [Oligoflexia bacterium]